MFYIKASVKKTWLTRKTKVMFVYINKEKKALYQTKKLKKDF